MSKMNRLKEIEERIAELETIREAENAIHKRVFDNIAAHYAERKKVGLGAPLSSLLAKTKLSVEDLEEFFKAEEKEAKRTITEVTPRLQLRKEELELMERNVRAVIIINPCSAFHSSPGWVCQPQATKCVPDPPLTTGDAVGSCTCSPPAGYNNRCDPKVQAMGTGSKGFSSAEVKCVLYFDIPARNNPQTVLVETWVDFHGFYILTPSTGMLASHVSLELLIEGIQYGYSWASATKSILNLYGNARGRIDKGEHLSFSMPIGGQDPFQVRVTLTLKASAQAGGASAVCDFASGLGNYINTIWVNTYGPLS